MKVLLILLDLFDWMIVDDLEGIWKEAVVT